MKPTKLLIIEDNDAVVFGYKRYLVQKDFSISTATTLAQARKSLSKESFDAVLLDLRLPDGMGLDLIKEVHDSDERIAIVVISGLEDTKIAVQAMKYGAHNFLPKPAKLEDVETSLRSSLKVKELRTKDFIRQRLNEARQKPSFGRSEKIDQILEFATVAAANDSVILLTGETGTGKGVLARWIHENSERKDNPFVELNCSALRGQLLRSELYGHTKGAFTSAIRNHEGLLEAADGGTLFLDEIGDMEIEVQAELLKTIEERTFRRIGENKLRKSDFRLICATNKDLPSACKENKFRSDLYYRICVFPIELPALRERKDDIQFLSERILNEFDYKYFPLEEDVLDVLKQYEWPGNIRELHNMLERALLLARGEKLSPKHFPGMQYPGLKTPNITVNFKQEDDLQPFVWNLEEIKDRHIHKALSHFGDKNKASRALGISLATLYRKISNEDEKSEQSESVVNAS